MCKDEACNYKLLARYLPNFKCLSTQRHNDVMSNKSTFVVKSAYYIFLNFLKALIRV